MKRFIILKSNATILIKNLKKDLLANDVHYVILFQKLQLFISIIKIKKQSALIVKYGKITLSFKVFLLRDKLMKLLVYKLTNLLKNLWFEVF